MHQGVLFQVRHKGKVYDCYAVCSTAGGIIQFVVYDDDKGHFNAFDLKTCTRVG